MDVSSGQFLSKSLSKHKGLLSTFAVHIIQVGEESGTLSENLEYLADELKKKSALQRKMIGACIYPVVVLLATFRISLFLILYLFPKIIPIFSSLQMKLPLTTRILIEVSKLAQSFWVPSLIAITAVGIGLALLIRNSTSVRSFVDRVILRIPLFGPVIRAYHLAHICRVTGLLLHSGISLTGTMSIVANVIESAPYREHLDITRNAIARGETVSTSLSTAKHLYPDIAIHLVSVGERSGNLATSLQYLSEFFEQEVDDFTKNLGSIIEPLLMIIMGLVVGFIAISIITPIYGITQNLH